MILLSARHMMVVPRALRFIDWERLRSMWFLQAKFRRIFPVAVSEKRFLALLFDLSFGI
jgi:hypothetical protein